MDEDPKEYADKNGFVMSGLWRCPGCGRTYINSEYCPKCDILPESGPH